MASANKTVTVLTPNGRRQNVKVTPNNTILQILEEVCQKQGFKVEEYDLKHHNNVLDVSSIIRFSGLPNNAQLEMCPIQRLRTENPVILGLQLENGTRLTGNYIPNESLWNILNNLCPNELKMEENPVIIYMRQEVYGLDALQSTTLKSLGLTGGRAMLRLIHRRPEELKTQANVSVPLPSKPVEEKPYIRKFQKLDSDEQPKGENEQRFENNKSESKSSGRPSQIKPYVSKPAPAKPEGNFINNFIKKERANKTNDPQKIKSSKNVENIQKEIKEKEEPLEEVVFLGERSALAFSLDMAQTVPAELPDEFFDLTIQDAKRLLRDLKQQRVELEESPLQTAAQRNLEQNKKVLRHLNQYKKSIIRVQFPDRTVLQGTFKPMETIQNVKEFVVEYLEDSKCSFHLYTTPPKNILEEEKTLLDVDCVPSALIHFGIDSPVQNDQRYLKQTVTNQFTSPDMATLAALKSRECCRVNKKMKEDDVDNMDISELADYKPTSQITMNDDDDDDVNVGASTSRGQENVTKKENVPKWFKGTK